MDVNNGLEKENSKRLEFKYQRDARIHDHPKLSKKTKVLTSLTAGSIAGGLAKTCIAPLDRTKIYFQCRPDRSYRISNAFKFLRKTYTNDGFLSLWRGNSATMARIIPYAGIQFMSHEQYKEMLGCKIKDPSALPGYKNFLAGSLAGLTGQSITYPLDRARAVMAVTKVGQYRNLCHVFRSIVRNEGALSFYTGLTPTLCGVVMYAGTSFFIYETLKSRLFVYNQKYCGVSSSSSSDPSVNAGGRWMSGALAGLCGQVSSYPLDIVRRRMQTARQMGLDKDMYSGILQTLLKVYKTEGVWRGWYKGISMNAIKGPIATGISFTTFDYSQLFLRKVLLCVNAHVS